MEDGEIKSDNIEENQEKQESKSTENKIENNNDEKNEIIINEIQEEYPQIKLDEETSKINKINIEENSNNDNKEKNNIDDNENNIEIKLNNQNSKDFDEIDENISLINIDIEKEKNEKINKEKKIVEKVEKELEEDMNKKELEEHQEIEDQNPENLNVDDYLFNENDIDSDNLKCNKEYTDNDEDLHSRRLTARNNNDDYLMKDQEKDEGKNKNVLEEYKVEDDDNDQNEEEDNFPFKIVGDTRKKSNSNFSSTFNYRYIEIDSVKGLFKRYYSTKDYPKKPKEIIDIKNFKLIKKQKLIKEYYDLEITYLVSNKKGKQWEVVEYYRFRHQECRNKWFDSLLYVWKSLIKGTKLKITKNILSFVDDRLGIIQDIGRKNKQKNKQRKKIDFKKFKVISLLGIGGFGTVFKVRHILTDKVYAMKVMNKNYIIEKKYLHYVVSEFEIMKKLAGFPFILDLHYCFQTANYLYLIIDYCPNGDFTKLESLNNPKLFFAEMILAIEYIHNKNIIYRDLKPENILLDETGHIKLCDFNLAKGGMTKHKRADSFCGSPLYFSPEIVQNQGSNYKSDIYGIGLIMYEIITGHTAYYAKNIEELYAKIKKNRIDFKDPKLKGDAKDLIMKLCAINPDDRIELIDVKKHKYFQDIDFDKVLNKEYGIIETVKKNKKKKINIIEENNINNNKDGKIMDKEYLEHKKFLAQQRILDEDEELNVANGKISLKEMMLDQTRHMKNEVRQFYYVKEEDAEQTEDFKLEINGNKDISSLIMDQYNA